MPGIRSNRKCSTVVTLFGISAFFFFLTTTILPDEFGAFFLTTTTGLKDKKVSNMLGYQREELLQIDMAHFGYGKVWKEVRNTRKTTASVPPLCKRQKVCETTIKNQSQQFSWIPPDLLRYNKAKATRGDLSSLHNRFAGDIRPHAVGKRTPRFPVKYSDAEECGGRATPKADQDSRGKLWRSSTTLAMSKASVRDDSLPASSFLSKLVKGVQSLPIQRDGIKNNPERCLHVKNEIGISVAAGQSNTPGFDFTKSTSCKISDSSSLQKPERKALLPCCKLIPEQKNYDFQPSGKTWKMKKPTAAKEVEPSADAGGEPPGADAGCEPQSPEKTLFITYTRRAKDNVKPLLLS